MNVWTVLLLTALAAAGAPIDARAPAAQTAFPQRWIDGTDPTEPPVQVHRFDPDLFILRQSIRTQAEGPFMYLLFGTERALLLDTGAGNIALGPVVDGVMQRWLQERGRASIPLVVAHSHAHGDHWAGDGQFQDRPGIVVVKRTPEDVQKFFQITSWPDQVVPFDLGGRIVDVIPAPGHERSHVILFDRRTRLLLTGDTLYPGRLYVPVADFDAYRRTIDRVVQFTKALNVSWVLGAHIEMTQSPGRD